MQRMAAVTLNADESNAGSFHIHSLLSEYKVPPRVAEDIEYLVKWNMSISPKKVQKGQVWDSYRLM